MHSEPILVIGGGLAAATCVTALREHGYTGELTLVSDEKHLPYERPPLSKDFLQGNSGLADFTVADDDWYRTHEVQLHLGVAAESIDRAGRTVQCTDGRILEYGQLVLATGSRANTGQGLPGSELPGVHVLRTVDDARTLRQVLLEGTRVAIIGSGWIGMEAAASARQRHAEVTVVSPSTTPLAAALGEGFGSYLTGLHRDAGVRLVLDTRVNRIEARGRELILHAGDRQISADTVLLAIGASPNLELARDAGLETDDGVVTDASLRTSDGRILAIGDIARSFNTRLRRQLRVEHWDNAIRQAKLAASTLTGGDAEYDWYPYFFTDQFDLGMEFVGHRLDGDTEVVRGNRQEGQFIMFWLREGRISAAMNVNIWDVNDSLRALLGRQVAPDRLADNSIPLDQLADR